MDMFFVNFKATFIFRIFAIKFSKFWHLLSYYEGPFKTRIYGHNTNIKNRHHTGTRLSKYIWKLKDNKPHPILYEIEWEILGKVKPYNPVTGVCRLCLLEAYHLMFDEMNTTLNGREEYRTNCPHKRSYILVPKKT